jgi:phosphocarrier protein
MTDDPKAAERRTDADGGDHDHEGRRRPRGPAAVQDVLIRNRLGLHARAAAQFVKMAAMFKAEITVEAGTRKVNGKSIMGLLMLAAGDGTHLTLKAVGPDAAPALEALAGLVAQRFGEAE